jgi:sec-independent protein translocase protein TatA
MGDLSPLHLVIVLVVALIVIGPGKLPETGAALGRAIRDFRHAVSGGLEPANAPQPAAPVAPDEVVTPSAPPPEGS